MSCNTLPCIFEDVPSTLPPSGEAGGDLSGTYPNPEVTDDSHGHTGDTLSAITDASVDAANKDGAAGTPSLRTLGTGAQQAAAGNDSRLSNARTPTAHASSHQPGGSDAMSVDAAAGTGSLRTLGTGAQQAAAGNDSRLSDSRTPTAHASSHQPGGSDEIAVSTPAANAIPKTDSSAVLDGWLTVGAWGFYGDGNDGDGTIMSGTPTTLTRDMYYQNLTVNSSATLKPNGYIIFVSQTLTIQSGGLITDPGNNGSTGTGGVGLAVRGSLATDSGAGGNGASGTGTGANGTTGSTPPHHFTATSYQGGGGGSASGHGGGTGGNPGPRPASAGSIRHWPAAGLGHAIGNGGVWPGGGGGGGGGGGSAAGGTTGGGGGGGGGSVVVRCRYLNSSGTISAPGGAGAAATGSGAAGGGGGGAGGWVSVCAGKVIAQGTLSAAGGSGGAGINGGATGGNGANGFTQILTGSP